jgi:5'-nucleotidase
LGHSYKNELKKISDITLAKSTKNIDLIIGGHTHTFLDRPEIVTNIDGEKVIINQVGCFGLYLGQIDFYFDAMNNKTSNAYAIEV